MRISELIYELNKLKKVHGDVLVGFVHDWTDEVGFIEFVEEQPTGFNNDVDGQEFVRSHALLSASKENKIFFRRKY